MGKSQVVTCPICHKSTNWDHPPKGTFCSLRCKMIDLGNWLDGEYSIEGLPRMDIEEDLEFEEKVRQH